LEDSISCAWKRGKRLERRNALGELRRDLQLEAIKGLLKERDKSLPG